MHNYLLGMLPDTLQQYYFYCYRGEIFFNGKRNLHKMQLIECWNYNHCIKIFHTRIIISTNVYIFGVFLNNNIKLHLHKSLLFFNVLKLNVFGCKISPIFNQKVLIRDLIRRRDHSFYFFIYIFMFNTGSSSIKDEKQQNNIGNALTLFSPKNKFNRKTFNNIFHKTTKQEGGWGKFFSFIFGSNFWS